MRTHTPSFDMLTASSIRDAVKLLASDHSVRPFAGGTDLMVEIEAGVLEEGRFINIKGIAELNAIESTEEELHIGGCCTQTQIAEHPVVRSEFPLLREAARQVGAVAIQNRATIAGNIANASPAADLPPALLVYDCELELSSVVETRRVAYSDFHLDYKKMDLKPGELITKVILSRGPGSTSSHARYWKVGTRKMQAISKVVFAGRITVVDDVIRWIKLGYGSVAPIPKLAEAAEGYLLGKRFGQLSEDDLRRALAKDIAPITDVRSNKDYREQVAFNVLWRFLQESKEGAR